MSLVLSGSGSITGLVPGGIPSEDLAYTPAGTGAVETTVQTKLRESVSILDFTGLVASDDWAPAIQAAVDYCAEGAGKTLHFPRGSFTVKSPIFITTNGQHWVGESPGRGTFGKGTQIVFDMASGSCIENGTDDGIAWDSSTDYNGPQLQTFENINFYVKAERRTDALNSVGNYAPGAYGIRDWRGGHIRLNNVTFEGFEYSFWGIKSDFSTFTNVNSFYSKYGMYIGPRSDQISMYDFYAFFCDHAITVDGASGLRLFSPNIVVCGSDVDHAVLVRRGSGLVTIETPWFEYLTGPDIALAFVGAGTELGYGSNDTFNRGLVINNPFITTGNSGSAGSCKYLVEIGKSRGVVVRNPAIGAGQSLSSNLLYFAAFQSGIDHTSSFSQLCFYGMENYVSKVFTNLGTGTPEVYYEIGNSGSQLGSSTGRLLINRIGASAGAEIMRIGTEGGPGEIRISTPTYPTYQTLRVLFKKSIQHNNIQPTSGSWEAGDYVWNTGPSILTWSGGFAALAGAKYVLKGWVRLTTGSAHVDGVDWEEDRALTGA